MAGLILRLRVRCILGSALRRRSEASLSDMDARRKMIWPLHYLAWGWSDWPGGIITSKMCGLKDLTGISGLCLYGTMNIRHLEAHYSRGISSSASVIYETRHIVGKEYSYQPSTIVSASPIRIAPVVVILSASLLSSTWVTGVMYFLPICVHKLTRVPSSEPHLAHLTAT